MAPPRRPFDCDHAAARRRARARRGAGEGARLVPGGRGVARRPSVAPVDARRARRQRRRRPLLRLPPLLRLRLLRLLLLLMPLLLQARDRDRVAAPGLTAQATATATAAAQAAAAAAAQCGGGLVAGRRRARAKPRARGGLRRLRTTLDRAPLAEQPRARLRAERGGGQTTQNGGDAWSEYPVCSRLLVRSCRVVCVRACVCPRGNGVWHAHLRARDGPGRLERRRLRPPLHERRSVLVQRRDAVADHRRRHRSEHAAAARSARRRRR